MEQTVAALYLCKKTKMVAGEPVFLDDERVTADKEKITECFLVTFQKIHKK